MNGDEKERAKRLAAPYHDEAQRKAKEMVKTLLAEIKDEPLPNERALNREDKEMVEIERRLAKILTPVNRLDDRSAASRALPTTKSKNSRKNQKKK